MDRLTFFGLIALLASGLSCGGDDDGPAGTDGGLRIDSGARDAGGGTDTGPSVDAGGAPDAGAVEDAGADTDAGAMADAGMACTPTGGEGCAGEGALPCCVSAAMCCAGIPLPEEGRCLMTTACPISDRNVKHGFEPVDPESVLETLASVPVTSWSYDFEPGARHMGPMAQDFHEAFGLGADDRMIHPIDSAGVSIAAIQALRERTAELRRENTELRDENARLRAEVEAIDRRLDTLERAR